MRAEDRGQRTEDRGQKTEGRGQRTQDRRRKAEDVEICMHLSIVADSVAGKFGHS